MSEPSAEPKRPSRETTADKRQRLQPVLDTLRAAERSVFLDLCELLLMECEDMPGSLEWDHPRVLVKIRLKATAERRLKKAALARLAKRGSGV